ncbi:MAG: NADH-ubiquinone oxidoreductase-F iron-sulfur binding region domain-containing protein [Acidimicrobiia bacterium]
MTFLARVLPTEPVTTLDEFFARGGHTALERAHDLGPVATIAELDRAGLRGRGGGGFPTGRKWSTVRESRGSRHFVVVNAAEGEPGTFKDRAILRRDPYQVLAGAAIAALTVDAHDIYVGVKASFTRECEAVERAAQDMAAAGLLDDLDLTIVRGPDEYLFGEEKALLEVIEGNDPLPRVLPPFQHGLFATAPQLGWTATEAEPGEARGDRANPTLVNNVETLAHATWILAEGAEAFRTVGTEQSPGTMVFTLCGDVAQPCVTELALGTTVRELIETHAGGTRSGRPVKLVCSGVANSVLPATRLDTSADFEALAAAGAGLGSAGFVVYDDETCALAVARLFSRFLYVESCGQCPPCKLQSGVITTALERIEAEGDTTQLALVQRALETVADGNRCYLAVEEQQVVSSILREFPEDIVAHEERRCGLRHDLVVPKLVDFDGTEFMTDERQVRKQPDWTYA